MFLFSMSFVCLQLKKNIQTHFTSNKVEDNFLFLHTKVFFILDKLSIYIYICIVQGKALNHKDVLSELVNFIRKNIQTVATGWISLP